MHLLLDATVQFQETVPSIGYQRLETVARQHRAYTNGLPVALVRF